MISLMIAALAAAVQPAPAPDHPIYELRQYKIVHGQRDRFIDLFDREFVETQEAVGMELIGQYRDQTDPDRFTWIRVFPSMEARKASLTAFYYGPVWKKHRAAANPMLFDNDNVLLLRPVTAEFGFKPTGVRALPDAPPAPARLIVATIHYLWKSPEEGFASFFADQLAPALKRAGLPVEAALVREQSINNFPALPVREGEKIFVWQTSAATQEAWSSALERLARDPEWPSLAAKLRDFEERPAQRLLLDPTSRSRLR